LNLDLTDKFNNTLCMFCLEKLASDLGLIPEVTGRIERMVGLQHV